MALDGWATAEGTRRYRERMVAAGLADEGHFREGLGGLVLSSVGLGTYLGDHDDRTDAGYREAIAQAVTAGCNVLDSAINYRCQRSERAVGRALADLVRTGAVRRDEILVTTKGGYIPYEGAPPRDHDAYVRQAFVMPGIVEAGELVGGCHCLSPRYLRHQVEASRKNLGLACLDVYYLHNPESQLDEVSREEFLARMRAAFETLEGAAGAGALRVYGTATWNGYRTKPGARGHLSLETLVGLAREVGGPTHRFRVVQLPYNLAMPEALAQPTQPLNGRMVPFLVAAQALGLYVMASASILQGRLSDGLPGDLRGKLNGDTDAQRAIQFVRSTPGLGTALVGMGSAGHVKENLAVARRAPLTAEQFGALFA
jgi:aryl-alcohol dehydrogenase-like predicted oxidoreductase